MIEKFLNFEEFWSDDKKRKSYLLNFIHVIFLLFLVLIIAVRLAGNIFHNSEGGQENLMFLYGLVVFVLLLSYLVKKGFVTLVSFALIGLLLFACIRGSWMWGIDLYTVDIVYPLIILLAGLLVGPGFAFTVLLTIIIFLYVIFVLQDLTLIPRNAAWRNALPDHGNIVTIIIIYTLMTVFSWLSAREIEKSLHKARSLAKKLHAQNENLELTVAERTQELRNLQLKQLVQIAPLLDLGKLSAGLVHDIRQPLSVLQIVIDKIHAKNRLDDEEITLALAALKQINDLAGMSVNKFKNDQELEVFDLTSEVEKLLQLFVYKARSRKVKIVYEHRKPLQLHAERKKLLQVLANLIMNALEAYEDRSTKEKFVFIKFKKKRYGVCIEVKDYGKGISPDVLKKLFEPGFSTKSKQGSLGLGLYVANEVMKECFVKPIEVRSAVGKGSCFTLIIKNNYILHD